MEKKKVLEKNCAFLLMNSEVTELSKVVRNQKLQGTAYDKRCKRRIYLRDLIYQKKV